MSSLVCINCGATLDADTISKYIKCNYCKTFNSNFSTFDNIEALLIKANKNEKTDVYKDLHLSFKLKDYDNVKKISNSILNKTPNDWFALTYLSIADFWLGYDDFEHIKEIYDLINKAKALSSNNEIVVDAAHKIANNIVVLASKNSTHGDELDNALFAFEMANKISTLDIESEECLKKYLLKAFEYQKKQLNNLLEKNGKNYDPPYNSLKNLFRVGFFYKKKEVLELFYLHTSIHLKKGKTKSYYNDLLNKYELVKKILKSQNSDLIGKNISFNFFGKLQLK